MLTKNRRNKDTLTHTDTDRQSSNLERTHTSYLCLCLPLRLRNRTKTTSRDLNYFALHNVQSSQAASLRNTSENLFFFFNTQVQKNLETVFACYSICSQVLTSNSVGVEQSCKQGVSASLPWWDMLQLQDLGWSQEVRLFTECELKLLQSKKKLTVQTKCADPLLFHLWLH